MVPCTPLGCLMMLRDHLGTLAGVNAVVIGKSNIVGKPMIQLLLNDGATVTTVHSRTRDIESITRTADVLVVAVGRPEMVKPEWIKEGAVISMLASTGCQRLTLAKTNPELWVMSIMPDAPKRQGPLPLSPAALAR